MRKVLVLGIRGMAGHVVFKMLQYTAKYEVYGIARNIKSTNHIFNLDVFDSERLKEIIQNNNFDTIINCIGILNKDAEDHPAKAIWLNSYLPHFLEDLTKNTSTKIIHISTDCVFSGERGNYIETDQTDGKGIYAQSKALGELNNSKDLTIRTSIIGPEFDHSGIGLFHWFMSQSKESMVKGYSSAFWSGITTIELSKYILHILERDEIGLIQISNNEKIDKFSLLTLINEIFRGKEIKITPYPEYKVDKSLISKSEYIVPTYREMLEEMKQWIYKENVYGYEA